VEINVEDSSSRTTESGGLFRRLAPVLNVADLAAEREFYERLGFPVIYEGPEYPTFIAFGTDSIHFGIQQASGPNDPPSVLTWQIAVADVDAAMERCRTAAVAFELEQNDPAPGWSYRRLILRTPSGFRLVLEGESEAQREL
jgi:catechol 2,3-dioxygenase-like lactoylglutathione lyase family enzyme